MRIASLLGFAAVLGLTAVAHAAPETYTFDQAHTGITWQANHFGFSNPTGKFIKTDGSLKLDEKSPEKSSLDVTIAIDGLVTGLPDFDKHLKSADFFDIEKFPTARFVSTSVKKTGDKTADVAGKLTLHGVTKPVTLHVTLNKLGINDYTKKQTAGFTAETTIKRSDFGMSYAIPGVSDDVKITIETETNLAAKK